MMPLTIPSGFTDGAMICSNVSLHRDNLVEPEEKFSVELALDNIKDNLILGNSSTSVILKDSDGMKSFNC